MAEIGRGRSFRAAWIASTIATLVLGGGLTAAWWAAEVPPLRLALVGISGSITLTASIFLIESLARGEGLQFDSHWGGLGGGMGGWRASPNATLTLFALIFLAATFAAAAVEIKIEKKGPAAPPGKAGPTTTPGAAAVGPAPVASGAATAPAAIGNATGQP